MTMTVIYDRGSHAVLVINPPRNNQGNPILPEGMNVAAIDISDAEGAKFAQLNAVFTVDNAGLVTVAAAPPANLEQIDIATSKSDLKDQYQTAIDRLDQIIGATSPTTPQVIAAIRDLATIQRRVLRLAKNVLT